MTLDVQANEDENLSIQEQLYVENRLAGMTKAAAARAAGMSDTMVSNAYRVEAKPSVRAAMRALRLEARRNAKLTRDEVLEGMQQAVHTAATSTELLNAWREIGKFLGYYEETTIRIKQQSEQIQDTKSLTIEKLRQLSPERLIALSRLAENGEAVEDADFVEVEVEDDEYDEYDD